jgi:ABC-type antimicrobial peptide transport system permease subunit
MLMAEAVTILLSSGSMGAVVGWFIAWMLETNMSVITEIPAVTAVNIGTLASTFLFSVGVSIVGMFFITRKVEKMQVIDVLRSSF